ncbi:hypothetical protein ColKHC_06015 [Colletotrichum higginsianum]|nr:hypothetical protein ColKHC_06015 [Colletotrichum higginsianum]
MEAAIMRLGTPNINGQMAAAKSLCGPRTAFRQVKILPGILCKCHRNTRRRCGHNNSQCLNASSSHL